VEFKVGANSETALNDVRDSVSRIRQQLPQDINEPIINHPNGSGDPFITYALTSESRPQGELSKLIDEDITRSLLTVPGVASVRREGGLTREIRVKLSPARLQAMGTSVDFVNGQLRSLNLNLPGGKSELAGGDVGIRTMGSVRTIEQLKSLAIPLGNGHSARLDELGTVEDAFADVSQIARFDGQPVVGFSVIRSQGAPLVQTEEGTRAQIALLEKAMPADLHFKLLRTQATFTRSS
jgi:multidrug efflux pump subunit AcrB